MLCGAGIARPKSQMMRTVIWCTAWVIAATVCGVAWAGQQSDDTTALTLSRSVPVVRVGDAVLLTVDASAPFTTLEGDVFGRPVSFWPSGARQWQGLVGIDLEVEPGTYDLHVRATGAQGTTEARMPLPVSRRQVETRRIRVADRFVQPAEEEAERIRLEAELLANVLERSQTARLWRGAFTVPVPGQPTSSFGRLTIMNDSPRGRHRGVDFRAAEGTPVRAPNAGLVVLAADLYFTGNTVVLDHGGGLISLFAHLSRLAVAEGALVAGGDVLGDAGATGRVTGPHLHWAMRLGGATVDPLTVISASSRVSEPLPR
jgi:murein DD-endopeptidase MepM/ murein hydrolase activator NlpD